jgi:hypothetical protein
MYELPRVSFPGSRNPFHVMKCLAPATKGPMKINNAVLSYVTFHQAVVFHPIISFENNRGIQISSDREPYKFD